MQHRTQMLFIIGWFLLFLSQTKKIELVNFFFRGQNSASAAENDPANTLWQKVILEINITKLLFNTTTKM